MIKVDVTKSYTVRLPNLGTSQFVRLAEAMIADCYDPETNPDDAIKVNALMTGTNEDLIKAMAVYVAASYEVGNHTDLVEGWETEAEIQSLLPGTPEE